MFLSDKTILGCIQDGTIKIEPFKLGNVQNNSYLLESAEAIDIYPLENKNIWTMEKITLPNNMIGLLTARSSIARKGLFFATSIGVDAGFSGNLIIEFFNIGKKVYRLKQFDKIVHILFAQTTTECTPYKGIYQGQDPTSLFRNV
jgi:deoxycytidine triphosphate deaminase